MQDPGLRPGVPFVRRAAALSGADEGDNGVGIIFVEVTAVVVVPSNGVSAPGDVDRGGAVGTLCVAAALDHEDERAAARVRDGHQLRLTWEGQLNSAALTSAARAGVGGGVDAAVARPDQRRGVPGDRPGQAVHRSGGSLPRQGGVDFGVVRIEVGAQDLVLRLPLVQLVVGCVIGRHRSTPFSRDSLPRRGSPHNQKENAPKWDVFIHLMEIRAHCAFFQMTSRSTA